MITKTFEIRDRMTFIPVIATAMSSDKIEEAYLFGRAGFTNLDDPSPVIITRLTDCGSASSRFEWGMGPARTMYVAHSYIEEHFHELETGAVIDVEFILDETAVPKVSERLVTS